MTIVASQHKKKFLKVIDDILKCGIFFFFGIVCLTHINVWVFCIVLLPIFYK